MAATNAEMDNLALYNIRERNISRVREIDAVLGELLPVVSRLQRERKECTDTVSRINVNATSDTAQCGGQIDVGCVGWYDGIGKRKQ